METQNGRSRTLSDSWIERPGIPLNVGVMQINCFVGNCKDIEERLELLRSDNSVSPCSFVMTRLKKNTRQ